MNTVLANIKLISGEDIVGMATLHQDSDRKVLTLLVESPVVINALQSKKTKQPIWDVRPWMPLSDENELHIIDMDKVISWCMITNKTVVSVYNRYLRARYNEENGLELANKVQPSNSCKMKVSEFRQFLIDNYSSL